MATQKTWDYNDFVRNWNAQLGGPGANAVMGALGQTGDGTLLGRSMTDAMRQSLAQQFGPQAMQWSDSQVHQAAQQSGILGGKEQGFGEIAMEGLTGPLAIPAAFLTAGALTGAFEGVGAASAGGSAAGAGGASAAGGGYLMPAAVPESAATLAEWGLVETAPGVWSAAGPATSGSAGALAGGTGEASVGSTAPATAPVAAPAATSVFDKVLSSPSILGMAGGALLGGMGGSEQTGTMTTEEGLPDWLQAYAKPALDKYGTQLQNYNIDPYGVMSSAGKQYSDTINGMYLDPATNKYLTDYFNAGAERIKGTVSPSFGHMQAFGSHTGYNEALSRGLGDFATGLYGGNYAKERDRQTQLTAAAPNFLQSQSQAAFSPYQNYLNTISGLGKKKEQPFYENQMGNMLGGAMAGYGLGGLFK
jgi:hypothetical protein